MGEVFLVGLHLAQVPVICQETSCVGSQPNVPLIPEHDLCLSHSKAKGSLAAPLLSSLMPSV